MLTPMGLREVMGRLRSCKQPWELDETPAPSPWKPYHPYAKRNAMMINMGDGTGEWTLLICRSICQKKKLNTST